MIWQQEERQAADTLSCLKAKLADIEATVWANEACILEELARSDKLRAAAKRCKHEEMLLCRSAAGLMYQAGEVR